MAQLVYVLQFKGTAMPVDGAPNVMRAATSAAPCSVTTRVGPDGIRTELQALDGPNATFESEVTITGDTEFVESGTIRFGDGASVQFSTVGNGYLAPSPEQGTMAGAVTWRIDGGTGQLEGASGLITSNFTVGSAGEVTDNHFGVMFLP
jgi:hypothetical protein